MVRRVGGSRKKSRSKFRKNVRQKGKVSLTRYFTNFNIGEHVQLNVEPSIHTGFYHSRFHGRAGVIKARRGRCYEVMVKDKDKDKLIIIHPVHLSKLLRKA